MTRLHFCRARLRWLLFCCLVHSPATLAVAGESAEPSIYNSTYLIQVLGALLLVFGCLFGVLFLLKKMNGFNPSDKRAISVLGSLKVGTREKVLLLQAGDRQLLIGVAAGNVRSLHVFDTPVIEAEDTTADFSDVLRRTAPLAGDQ